MQVRSRHREHLDDETVLFPENSRQFRQNGTYPLYAALIVLGVGALFYGVSLMLNNWLPRPLYNRDAVHNKFIAENAIHHLRHLSSIGPKVAGSHENEVLAVDFLKREINFIMQRAKSSNKLFFDVQKSTGCFVLHYKPYGFVNCYTSVQNVIVKLISLHNSSAVLVNCHYDSVPTSPGASDDGLNCAVMLEVMRVLSQSDEPLEHNVIFLFNGAEENPLQASHGFITQHPWATEVQAFINLEATGAGGREVLFQTGPKNPWLLQMYADSVPHPHGVVIGEEIFQSGLVPSDTDFRVFRDFGNISGLDFAHKANGYVYHTVFDDVAYIPDGTYQHTGDNLLALVKKIASSEELNNKNENSEGRVVYTDVFGLFIIYYNEFTGFIINMCTLILSIYTLIHSTVIITEGLNRGQIGKQLLLSAVVPLIGWILSAFAVFAIALLLDAVGKTMSWYTRSVGVFFLYYCPVLFCSMLPVICINKMDGKIKNLLPAEKQAQMYCLFVQLFWTVLMVVTTTLQLRTSYLFMLLTLLPCIPNFIFISIRSHSKTYLWLASLFGSLAIPVMLILYYTVLTFELFIPLSGRIGPDKNPEFFIGAFSWVLCIAATSYLTPLIVLVRRAGTLLVLLASMHMAVLILVIATPIFFPYNNNTLAPTTQRIFAFHTERVFYEPNETERRRETGYWVVPLDRNGPATVSSVFPEARSMHQDCDKEFHCGLPAFSVRLLTISKSTLWIPGPSPVIHSPTKIELTSQEMITNTIKRLSFNVTGPHHMQIHMSPKYGVKLVNWSFVQEFTTGEPMWKDRPTYFIHYGRGLDSPPWHFWFDVELPHPTNGSVIDLALAGQYMTSAYQQSSDFKEMLDKFPHYSRVVPWTSSYKKWEF